MTNFKLLLVEDDEQDLKTCRDCVKDFENDKACSIELVECRNVDEAFSQLDNSFDGAIIDLRLAEEGDEGNQVVRRIEESHFRIPVAYLPAHLMLPIRISLTSECLQKETPEQDMQICWIISGVFIIPA